MCLLLCHALEWLLTSHNSCQAYATRGNYQRNGGYLSMMRHLALLSSLEKLTLVTMYPLSPVACRDVVSHPILVWKHFQSCEINLRNMFAKSLAELGQAERQGDTATGDRRQATGDRRQATISTKVICGRFLGSSAALLFQF